MATHSLNRRDMSKISVLGAAALTLPFERVARAKSASRLDERRLPRPFRVPFAAPPVATPVRSDATTDFYEIRMREAQAEIIPGIRSRVWGYDGQVPGPTIKASQGRQSVVRFVNELPEAHPAWGYIPWTPWPSVHLHGSASAPQYDGYASDLTNPGQYKDYVYPNIQPARTVVPRPRRAPHR